MSVIPITVFLSLILAGLFVGLFAREQSRRRYSSPERESLLPLADESPRVAAPKNSSPLAENFTTPRGSSRAFPAPLIFTPLP